MSIKAIIGIVLIITGLGLGVWDWLRSGFSGVFPYVGLVMTAVGAYLFFSSVFSRSKSPSATENITKAAVTAGGVAVGAAIGTLAFKKLMEYMEERKKGEISSQEIIEIDKRLDELYKTGELDPERYKKAKELIYQLKVKKGLA